MGTFTVRWICRETPWQEKTFLGTLAGVVKHAQYLADAHLPDCTSLIVRDETGRTATVVERTENPDGTYGQWKDWWE